MTRVWARLAFGEARFPDARLGVSLPSRGTFFVRVFLKPLFSVSPEDFLHNGGVESLGASPWTQFLAFFMFTKNEHLGPFGSSWVPPPVYKKRAISRGGPSVS